tara:strand:- start:266 stop:538 length:273 start_codon:yes stop_codon:yes gene_type:complete
MPTLTQIRINCENKKKLELYNQINYKNPFMLSLISSVIKKQNKEFIKTYCKDNNISNEQQNELLKNFIKPNYYTPLVINSSSKEELQKII